MTTTRTAPAPTACTSCAGFNIDRPATVTAQYLPPRLGALPTGSETLCDTCASDTSIYCNIQPLTPEELTTDLIPCTRCADNMVPDEGIEVDPICASCAEVIAPTSRYADWFLALLAEDKVCKDWAAFERSAYQGHISYNLSMTDGYYGPEDFDAWVIGFRRDPISSIYHGNDIRHILAPRINSYIKIMRMITGAGS